ncbi:hypothetical protein ACFXJ5_01255 [Streptomyces sp. NPDC059373]
MSLMLPGEVAWVLDLLGYEWPEADEDKIVEAANAWRTFANEVAQLEARGVTAAGQVTSANAGDAVDSFTEVWKKFSDGGDGYLSDARETAEFIAIALDAVAVEVVIVKAMVIAQLIALAFEIAAAQAAAPFTFGLSEGGVLAATQAARLAVRELFLRLRRVIAEKIAQIAERGAVQVIKEFMRTEGKDLAKRGMKLATEHVIKPMLQDAEKKAAIAVGQDAVKQGIDMHYGAQDGYSVSETVKSGYGAGVEDFKKSDAYVEKATEAATEKGKEYLAPKVQPHINRLTGRTDEATGEGDGDSTNDGESTSRTQRAVRAVFG